MDGNVLFLMVNPSIGGFEFALDGTLNIPGSGVKYRKPTVALRK